MDSWNKAWNKVDIKELMTRPAETFNRCGYPLLFVDAMTGKKSRELTLLGVRSLTSVHRALADEELTEIECEVDAMRLEKKLQSIAAKKKADRRKRWGTPRGVVDMRMIRNRKIARRYEDIPMTNLDIVVQRMMCECG